MTRKEAIWILDPETTEEALLTFEHYNGFSGKHARIEACSDACKIAVAALRAQQPRLDRNRWEGCDTCGNQKIRELLLQRGKKYCHGCGRPLTADAWAELEMKVMELKHPPNEPLTLEELLEMDGEPVWVESFRASGKWAFVNVSCGMVKHFSRRNDADVEVILRHFKTYGETWTAYRTKPEEGT